MHINLRFPLGLLAAGVFLNCAARAQDAIKLGDLASYSSQPAFMEPYRKGWQLALEEINSKGGVLGKPLVIVSRDDHGTPGDAVRTAEELIANEHVSLLMGTFLSNVGLAVSDLAKHKKIFFLAAEPLTDKITWSDGNRYTYRLRSSTYMQVKMLLEDAVAAKKKRWALIYPNYEFGTAASAAFKTMLKERQADVEFVDFPVPFGKVDAGPTAQAIAEAKPDAIFNALFGPDLVKFAREGKVRNLFSDRFAVSLFTGEPEYLVPLSDEVPVGWVATGYPYEQIDTPEHKAFLSAYQKRWNDYPRFGSVIGYVTIKSIAAGITKAGSADTEKLLTAFRDLTVDGPLGPFTYRASDHQATMGEYVGTLALKEGKGVMTNFRFVDGAALLPSADEVKKLRPMSADQ